MAVHMLNWAIRSVKFLGVEFDQSEDEEVSVSDTTSITMGINAQIFYKIKTF